MKKILIIFALVVIAALGIYFFKEVIPQLGFIKDAKEAVTTVLS
jgi:uncharacterized protein YxeA